MSEKPNSLNELIKIIEKQNNITVEQFNQLKEYALIPGGFSADDEKSNHNQKVIINALVNMHEDKNVNFYKNYKRHPSRRISEVFKDEIENKNSDNEIIVLNKDIPRCIFNQWKNNHKEIDYELDEFQKQLEKFLKKNKTKYSYYQGYLDFCVFFYHLFYDKSKSKGDYSYSDAIKLFTELYLKDYISPFKSLGRQEDLMFENSIALLIDLIKLLDNDLYLKLKEESTPLCLCLSWMITLFTHEIHNFYTIRRILDYLLINEPINVYVMTAIIIFKNIQKSIKNIAEAEKEDIFLAIKSIDLNNIDFNSIVVECDKFIKKNLDDILFIQEKNQNLLLLVGDYNYRGVENIVYSYNKEILPDRYVKRSTSFIVSYRFVFILFLVWIFVLYYFQKDKIIHGLKGNFKVNENTTLKKINITEEDEEF